MVTATITGAIDLGSDLCLSGGSQLLDAGAGFVNYLWNTGETTQTITVSTSGTYSVQVDDGASCIGSDAVNVSFISAPTTNDTCLIGAGSVDLTASGSSGYYNWYDAASGGNLVGSGPTFTTPVLSSTTSYYVSATDTLSALEFDGTNDYVALNMAYTTTMSQFTAEAWVKTDFVGASYNDNWAIVDFDRSEFYDFYVRGDNGQVGFSTYSSSGGIDDFDSGTGNEVNDGQWHHIAVVYDGTDKIIYIDGVEVARNVNAHSGSAIGKNTTRYGFLGDGSEATSLNGSRNNIYFDGAIDEVRIWSSTRTAGEINSNKDVCLTGDETGLQAYYSLNEGSGTTVNDLSGNGRNGTLYNFNTSIAWIGNSPAACNTCESPRTQATVNVSSSSSMAGSQLTCASPTATLDAGAGFSSYLWNTGETTQTIAANQAGIYTVDVSGFGCSGSDTTSVVGFTSSENALVFDGNNDYAAIEGFSYSGTGHSEVTIETWIKTSSGANQIIASFDRNQFWRFEINGSAGTGQLAFDLMTSAGQLDFAGTARIDDGNWHHVAAVFDNGTVNIYIDGVLDATTTTGATFGSNATRYGFIGIGSEATTYNGTTGPNDEYNGEMDEFRIWNVARTQAQIRASMCSHISGGTPGLDVYYKFDESAGNKIFDYATSTPQNANMINFSGTARVVSGAPIGDLSANLYTGTWTGQSVNLTSCSSDDVKIDNITGTPSGVHLYYVNSNPNQTGGLISYNSGNHYYGTFIANGTTPTHNVTHSYPNHPLYVVGDEDDLTLMYRSDNTITPWDTTNATVNLINETVDATNQNQGEFILDNNQFIWTGTTNTDWATASNWNINSVPFSGASVKIPNVTNQPVLDGNRAVGRLSIDVSSSVDLNGFNLSVSKDLTANGAIICNGGTLIMNGTKTQLINTSTLAIQNITINNTLGVALNSGNLDLTGTMTLTNGSFNTNNSLTIVSDASGTGRIAEITGGSITGDVTMQRYIDAGATNWRFISSAVANPTITQFNDDFVTSGYPGASYPNWPSASNPWSSVYYYDETVAGVQDNGYIAPTSGANTIDIGEGLWVYSGDTSIGTQPFTIDLTGTANTGNINLPVSYTNNGLPTDDGWNMVGNPYPSTLDWDSPSITKSNINNAIYIWNPDIEQFASYVGGFGTNGGSRYVASTQAFWVQANAASPSIQVTEASKSTTDATFLKTNNSLPLIFNVQSNYGIDEMVINLNDDATTQFDAMYDAGKLASTNTNLPYICSVNNNTDLSINQFPAQEITVPIKLLTGVSGLHTISIENIEEYSDLNCMFLEDVFTGATYDIFNQQTITVYIYDSTTVARFLLHIGTSNNISAFNPTCSNLNDGLIVVENNSATGFESTLTDSEGNLIANNTSIYNIDSIINLEEGTYTIETIDPFCGSVSETITITSPQPIVANFNYTNSALDFTFTNTSQNGTSYLWNFGDGNTSTDINPAYSYSTEGTYLVTLTVYQNDDCFSSTSQWITIITTGIDVIKQENTNVWVRDNSLFINTSTNKFDTYQIKNSLGQLLVSESFNNNNKASYNLNNISSQVLFITLISPNNSKTIKVVYNK